MVLVLPSRPGDYLKCRSSGNPGAGFRTVLKLLRIAARRFDQHIGTGTDSRFNRTYNITLQARRHDPRGAYVRRYVEELCG